MTSSLPPSARLPEPYRKWNTQLVEELFPSGRAGVPVYLAVHDGVLKECGTRIGSGGRDDFVRDVLGLCAPPRFFINLEVYGEIWTENGRRGPPPFVAGLALAVLAASEMTTDDNAAQTNYYVRLNALLGIDGRLRPERFECTLELWKLLREWLRLERRGELVLRGLDGARPYVDPVTSQCLVRSCDIEDLVSLMRSAGMQAGQCDEPDDVLPVLRNWLLNTGRRSRLARLLGRDPDTGALQRAAEALCDAFEDYDAAQPSFLESIDSSPNQRPTRAALAIRPNRYPNLMWKRAEWLVRLAADLEADDAECLLAVGDCVIVGKLDARAPATYDAPISLMDGMRVFRGQVRTVDEDDVDISPPPSGIVWFQDGSVRGRPGSWSPIDAPTAGVEHAVVFAQAETFEQLRAALQQPPTLVVGSMDAWPGPGLFAVFAAIPSAGAMLPGNVAVQARASTIRLHDGLAIRRRVYLRGALPNAVLPDSTTLRVESTDHPDAIAVLPAAEIGTLDLPEGRYALRTEDGATVEIFVVQPRWRECAVPANARRDHEIQAAMTDASVRGAVVSVTRPVHATYLGPGTHYRVYAPNVIKGVAPENDGVHEVRTAAPVRQVVMTKRTSSGSALARADCFAEAANLAKGAYAANGPSDEQRSSAERLLEYVSARGAGSIDAVRAHCAAIAREGDSWHSSLSALEDLGHVDVSWESRRWTAAPAAMCTRAVDRGQAILVGIRARHTVAALMDCGVDVQLDARVSDLRRSVAPECIVVPTDAASRLSGVVAEIGLTFESSTAFTMALHVQPLAAMAWWLGAEFSPSSRVRRTLERWVPRQLRWASHAQDLDLDGPALYRWREHGVVVHYLVSGSVRARVRDPSAAKWFLAPTDRCYLMYDPNAQRLVVPLAIGLPRIWRRVCTSASGVMPARQGRLLEYDDIPLDLARAVAVRLNQPRGEGLF